MFESLTAGIPADPWRIEEYGYGLGPPSGILVLKYVAWGPLSIPEGRSDYLHQLYWTPDAPLVVRRGGRTVLVGATEAAWISRGVTHEILAPRARALYRLCLREAPGCLAEVRAATVSADDTARDLIAQIATPGVDVASALRWRIQIMAGLGATIRAIAAPTGPADGLLRPIVDAVIHDPADTTTLSEWARRLHTSSKTLQRQFQREMGMPYTQWRTTTRLQLAAALLATSTSVSETAHAVGYSSPSAFIASYTRHFGHTPGQAAALAPA